MHPVAVSQQESGSNRHLLHLLVTCIGIFFPLFTRACSWLQATIGYCEDKLDPAPKDKAWSRMRASLVHRPAVFPVFKGVACWILYSSSLRGMAAHVPNPTE